MAISGRIKYLKQNRVTNDDKRNNRITGRRKILNPNKNSPNQTTRAASVNKPTNILPAFTTGRFAILTQICFQGTAVTGLL